MKKSKSTVIAVIATIAAALVFVGAAYAMEAYVKWQQAAQGTTQSGNHAAQQAVSPAHNLILTTMDDPVMSGACGESLEWYYKDGVLVVTGTGKMNGYLNTANGAPWESVNDLIDCAVIDEGVTGIGSGALKDCWNMTEIVLPTSLIGIEEEAFASCSSLTKLVIPDSVTGIGNNAFCGCSALTELTIPDGVTWIGKAAFAGCSSLTKLVIPDGVTGIERSVFDDCSSLREVTIPEGVEFIHPWAFFNCSSLTKFTIPNSVTLIDRLAFQNCSGLTELVIPDSVTFISSGAFADCSSLKQVTILGAPNIEDDGNIFYGCSDMTVYYYDSALERYINSNTDLWSSQNITWVLIAG